MTPPHPSLIFLAVTLIPAVFPYQFPVTVPTSKQDRSPAYDFQTLIEGPPPLTFFPGHPKRIGDEIACIQIGAPHGVEASCPDRDKEAPGARHEAPSLALSQDGTLLAATDGSGIFIYETLTLKLRQTLNSRWGEAVADLAFLKPASNEHHRLLVTFADANGVESKKPYMNIYDLEEELDVSRQFDILKEDMVARYSESASKHMPWIIDSLSSTEMDSLVGALIWNTRNHGDVKLGKTFLGRSIESTGLSRLGIQQPYDLGSFILSTVDHGFHWNATNLETHQSVPLPLILYPTMQRLYPYPADPENRFVAFVKNLTEHEIDIVNITSGEIVRKSPLPNGIPAMELVPMFVHFSADGQLATVQRNNESYDVLVWEVGSGNLVYSIACDELEDNDSKDGPKDFYMPTFVPGGKLLAKHPLLRLGIVSFYDATDGKFHLSWNFEDLFRRVRPDWALPPGTFALGGTPEAIYSPNGLLFYTFGDGSIAVFDPETNREGMFAGTANAPKDQNDFRAVKLVISADEKKLYSASWDGAVRIWEL